MDNGLVIAGGVAALAIIGGTVIALQALRSPAQDRPETLRAIAEVIRALLGRAG